VGSLESEWGTETDTCGERRCEQVGREMGDASAIVAGTLIIHGKIDATNLAEAPGHADRTLSLSISVRSILRRALCTEHVRGRLYRWQRRASDAPGK